MTADGGVGFQVNDPLRQFWFGLFGATTCQGYFGIRFAALALNTSHVDPWFGLVDVSADSFEIGFIRFEYFEFVNRSKAAKPGAILQRIMNGANGASKHMSAGAPHLVVLRY